MVLFLIGSAKGWLNSLKLSKEGITFYSINRQVKLSTFNKLLDDKIHELDKEVEEFSLNVINNLRRIFRTHLDPTISHPALKRTISGAIRTPLYNTTRRNNFKVLLVPENLKSYVDKIIEEIKDEYDDATLEQKQYICPIHGGKCIEHPPFDVLEELIREKILLKWAIPLRNFQIDIHRRKIDLYEKHITSYRELGDEVRVKITEQCIEKNQRYMDALSRRPEAHEF